MENENQIVPQPAAEQPPVAPAPAPPVASPQAANRADIYQRYYGEQQQPAPAAGNGEQPALGVQPQLDPETAAALAAAQDRITQLEAALKQVAQPPTPPAPEPAGAPPSKKDWLAYLQEGDKEGFQRSFADAIRESVAPEVQQSAVSNALEMFRAESEISQFNASVRDSNPDLRSAEQYIALDAQAALIAAHNAGKINNVSQYVNEYKTAVQSAVDRARKLVQDFRAAGRQEGQTISREVVSSSPLPPQSFSPDRGVVEKSAEPQNASPFDYIRKRQERLQAARGLSMPKI